MNFQMFHCNICVTNHHKIPQILRTKVSDIDLHCLPMQTVQKLCGITLSGRICSNLNRRTLAKLSEVFNCLN
jgi:hypothetical protein